MDMTLYLEVILCAMFVPIKHSHGIRSTYCNGAYVCRHTGASNWTMFIDKNQLCDGIRQCPCGDDEEMCPIKVVNQCRLNFSYNSSFTNVAFWKNVTMSSVFDIGISDGSLLVDDNRDGQYPCAHTKEEINPYMMVDLEDTYNVHSLFVLNRLDCCSERLLNLKIELGETPDTMRTYVYLYGAGLDECTVVLDKATEARYVRVSVVGKTIFTLCELAVYHLG